MVNQVDNQDVAQPPSQSQNDPSLAKVRIGGFKVAQSVTEFKEALKLFNVSEVIEEEKDDQFFYQVTTTEAAKLVERFDGKELLRHTESKFSQFHSEKRIRNALYTYALNTSHFGYYLRL